MASDTQYGWHGIGYLSTLAPGCHEVVLKRIEVDGSKSTGVDLFSLEQGLFSAAAGQPVGGV